MWLTWLTNCAVSAGENKMRVMLDTNVLLSALLFPGERMNKMMRFIFEEHRLVLSSFVVEELTYVVKRKFPGKLKAADSLLAAMSFELAYTPQELEPNLFNIRDAKDYPVLYTAIREDVDVLITGDKDFSDVDVERPEILTPAQFIDRYMMGS